MPKTPLPIPTLSEADKARFLQKVSTTPTEQGCLEWLEGQNGSGYGSFRLEGKTFGSHRIAYFLHTGTDPAQFGVCHNCDNPPCCNAEHFFLGTPLDNARDRKAKNRGVSIGSPGDRNGARLHPETIQKGEGHHNAKLTNEQVLQIRKEFELEGATQRGLARKFKMSLTVIHCIIRKKLWKHIE